MQFALQAQLSSRGRELGTQVHWPRSYLQNSSVLQAERHSLESLESFSGRMHLQAVLSVFAIELRIFVEQDTHRGCVPTICSMSFTWQVGEQVLLVFSRKQGFPFYVNMLQLLTYTAPVSPFIVTFAENIYATDKGEQVQNDPLYITRSPLQQLDVHYLASLLMKYTFGDSYAQLDTHFFPSAETQSMQEATGMQLVYEPMSKMQPVAHQMQLTPVQPTLHVQPVPAAFQTMFKLQATHPAPL
ncbi:Hypothetical_protein [Hexamita inflata]|uniref:Hypothetical_protein n=1 Tax=Hexamita inflata TaxID=28002 RepID=A0AA86RHS6_9EUKA|nr:Hypothetical protein HINF_LOCUS61358 [Hexamita inflata]